MRVAGVDGCRAGWVAVLLDGGQVTGTLTAAGLATIVDACAGAAAIGVDMPLGLVDQGWRRADLLAAARLGRQRSRLFLVPPRTVWDAASYPDAVARCRELTEPAAGFSLQAWRLKDKLRQANELYADPAHRLFEVHPELAFARLGGGAPVAAGKKTWNGQMTRRALLERAGVRLAGDLGETGAVAPDDILDAAAVAWTAARIAAGEAQSLPAPPDHDRAGRPIAIWY